MNRYDVIVIGGGVNSLVAANMLGKSGKKVVVLEAQDQLGGLATTQEFSSVFKCNVFNDTVKWIDPRVMDKLDLNSHGLELIQPDVVRIALDKNGNHIAFHRDAKATAASITNQSEKDANAWSDFTEYVHKLAQFFEKLYALTPPSLPNVGLKEALGMRSMLGPVRKHGTRGLVDLMRVAPMMMPELVDEWFENELLRAAVSTAGIHHLSFGPFAAGTGYNLLHQHVHSGGVFHHAQFVKGGTENLAMALQSSAESAGVEIRTGTPVKSIDVENGVCSGVTLGDGESIEAAQVVSGLDPNNTFKNLVGASNLNPNFNTQLNNIRYRGSAARIYVEFTLPSEVNPDFAPDGKHVLSATVQNAPYKLRDQAWNEVTKNQLTQNVIRVIENYTPGFSSKIESSSLLTPMDMEGQFGLTEGNLNHGEMTLDQFMFMRPTASTAQYKSPVENLYLCGPGTHPGGGLHGTNGFNAAREMLK